ncbi:uncharacterized protein BDFB_012041 [Asbolus verrucosus]|uniref:Uncharacterized protein n=1 Tax=Asbolus verrucosus TaxID=1661398 RepID=A0A482VY56_ASBVE|nr:uncharacterized protein BDFB_012041 [Asbolus verrucosus]
MHQEHFYHYLVKLPKNVYNWEIKTCFVATTDARKGSLLLHLNPLIPVTTLFGLVERVCAVEMIPELFEIKRCTTDADCSPRICCPEKMLDGETVGYCRTAEPKLDNIPGVRQLIERKVRIVPADAARDFITRITT